MDAEQVALVLKAWAQENHLMQAEFPVSLDAEGQERDALYDSLAMSAISESILRRRMIVGVAFNDVANEVIVLTQKSVTLKELKALPDTISDAVTVRYMHAGIAQAGVPTGGIAQAPYVLHNGKYACGGSIHPARVVGAGTFGCLVRNANGDLFGLTNNHVSGMCNYAHDGEKILAPGHLDITAPGIDPFTIGYHFESLPMVHGVPDNVDIASNSDASLIRISNANIVSSMQGAHYDTPQTAFALAPGQQVQKVGRTTGLTTGIVRGQIAGAHPVRYAVPGIGNPIGFFAPVFVIQGHSGRFSDEGDSGSLIISEINGQRFAVGLLFAGDQQGLTYALPLIPILANLNVNLVSNHNI